MKSFLSKKMLRLIVLMMVLAMSVMPLASCGGGSDESSSGGDTITVVDHADKEVEVPKDIQRIAVCDIFPLPSVLAVFFNSADKIVGMPAPSMTAAQNGLLGELYPEILKAETGYIDGANVNMEELAKLEPDVVFYSASSPELGEQLTEAGFAAVAISVNKWDYDCIETLNNWIALLSQMFPDSDKSAIVEQKSREMYDLVQERVKNISDDQRANAFFLFQYNDTTLLTSGEHFFGQWWADAIGAKNVAKELTQDNSVPVNMEQVYDWNPDLIFITNFNEYYPEDLYNNTVEGYDWSPVAAVQNKNCYKMPLGMYRSYTPGVDCPVTLLWMAKTAYPEQFQDIDVIQEAKDYYKEVFGIELTDDQAKSIFEPAQSAGGGFAYQ
ncbi:MAG: Fe3+-citrate ABC transporter substrate-binding protein [Clostridiales bacterium]|jgi:iron complex transport system substrate-binding protein|nr:Fe3+-citrate ABC transporter substrate-binding protein [Clostridiales bacterium]